MWLPRYCLFAVLAAVFWGPHAFGAPFASCRRWAMPNALARFPSADPARQPHLRLVLHIQCLLLLRPQVKVVLHLRRC
jgi:hypothetical protein